MFAKKHVHSDCPHPKPTPWAPLKPRDDPRGFLRINLGTGTRRDVDIRWELGWGCEDCVSMGPVKQKIMYKQRNKQTNEQFFKDSSRKANIRFFNLMEQVLGANVKRKLKYICNAKGLAKLEIKQTKLKTNFFKQKHANQTKTCKHTSPTWQLNAMFPQPLQWHVSRPTILLWLISALTLSRRTSPNPFSTALPQGTSCVFHYPNILSPKHLKANWPALFSGKLVLFAWSGRTELMLSRTLPNVALQLHLWPCGSKFHSHHGNLCAMGLESS